MDGEQVFCLDMNEEVRVVARKKGFIQVTNDKEIHLITGLTLYRIGQVGANKILRNAMEDTI